MGRRTKLTAAQHAEIRDALRERSFLRKRIEQDRERLRQLRSSALADRYGVCDGTIKRILFGDPYAPNLILKEGA